MDNIHVYPRNLYITDLSLYFSSYLYIFCLFVCLFVVYLLIYLIFIYIYVAAGLLDFSAEEIRLEAYKANAEGKGDTYVSIRVGF